MQWLLVAAGGAVGATARYVLGGAVQRAAGIPFPLGTLVVNVLGCLCIGALTAVAERGAGLSTEARLFLIVGILGGFTTFSAYGVETYGLLRNGAVGAALANALGSVVLGLGAVWAGHTVARALLG